MFVIAFMSCMCTCKRIILYVYMPVSETQKVENCVRRKVNDCVREKVRIREGKWATERESLILTDFMR